MKENVAKSILFGCWLSQKMTASHHNSIECINRRNSDFERQFEKAPPENLIFSFSFQLAGIGKCKQLFQMMISKNICEKIAW